jgi:phage baseplate assembly protein W
MANIKLQTIAKPKISSTGFTYNDLHLDMEFDYTQNNELLKDKEIKDIITDYDYAAIRNSIRNLFLTLPGQKILAPEFGINLFQYLFRPCDTITANQIAKEIYAGILRFEPRVQVILVEVIALNGIKSLGLVSPIQSHRQALAKQGTITDENTYEVNLILGVPRVSTGSFKLVGTLSNSGFYFNN